MISKKYLLAAAFMLPAIFVHAQSDTSGSALKTLDLKEVIISVNKAEEQKKSVAQQFTVITGKDMEALQSQTTADLIGQTGQVFIQKSQQGGGSVTLRGFEANRNLLVIDGVRMNNLIYRAGHLQNIISTDINSFERVEILYGPSSTVYGSDALGGVVHMFTKKPLLAESDGNKKVKINYSGRYGSVNHELMNHVDFNIGTSKFASLTSFTFSKFDDLRGGTSQNPFYNGSYGERPYYIDRINGVDSLVKNDDRYLQVQSGYSQYDLMQKFLFKQSDKTEHQLNIQFSNSGDVPRYDRLTDPSGGGLRYAEWYYGPQTRLLTAYDLNHRNADGFFNNIHLGVNFQDVTESRHQRRFNNVNLQHRNESVQVAGINIDLQRNHHNHIFRMGFDGQYNMLKSTAENENIETGEKTPLDTRYPDGDNSMSSAAIYYSHTWKVNQQISIVDGFRVGMVTLKSSIKDTSFFRLPYTEIDQTTPVFSGSIGIINQPTEDWKISALLSTGFRVPNMDDVSKIFESSAGSVIVPNEDLKPEKTVTTELGITKINSGKSMWENTLWYTQFYDAIVTDAFKFNGQDSIEYDGTLSQVLANQNKRRAYMYGFSSSYRYQFNDHFVYDLSLNYTYGRVKTDSSDYPIDHIPPFMARMGLTYKNNKFSSLFYLNYNGWKKLKDYYLNGEDNEQYATAEGMPAWFTANWNVTYNIHKFVTVQAGVENIFDTQYRTFSSGINAPGRNVFFCLRLHY
jgi:hemoglobin/transferrin/lactoferrin receptor protein